MFYIEEDKVLVFGVANVLRNLLNIKIVWLGHDIDIKI